MGIKIDHLVSITVKSSNEVKSMKNKIANNRGKCLPEDNPKKRTLVLKTTGALHGVLH